MGFGEHSHKCLRRKSKAAKELAKKVGEQHWQVRIEGGFLMVIVIRRQSFVEETLSKNGSFEA